jgi:hypothetical protein
MAFRWRTDDYTVFCKPILDEDGYLTGEEVTVVQQLFGAGLLTRGPLGGLTYDHGWTYETVAEAVAAAIEWDGEGFPSGKRIKATMGSDALASKGFVEANQKLSEAAKQATHSWDEWRAQMYEASRFVFDQDGLRWDKADLTEHYAMGEAAPIGFTTSNGKWIDGKLARYEFIDHASLDG